MNNPYSLENLDDYHRWRDAKLAMRPLRLEELLVELNHPESLSTAERNRIRDCIARANLVLLQCTTPAHIKKESLVRLGAQLGLTHLDGNLCADEDAVSTITVGGGGERGSDYIPYTDRPLSWHTDGYYNAPQQQIRAWALMCVRDAPEGGENTLMDHEILYLQLRDEEPEYIRALMADDAMGIPANMVHGRAIRPARLGPVFSVHPVDGSLHMRYSARARNIEWKSDAATRAALACMQRLFSPLSPYIYRHRLAPGQCLLSNNVLHNRSGFRDTAGHRRVVYRVRYYDRISL